jgi:hypothetical protein
MPGIAHYHRRRGRWSPNIGLPVMLGRELQVLELQVEADDLQRHHHGRGYRAEGARRRQGASSFAEILDRFGHKGAVKRASRRTMVLANARSASRPKIKIRLPQRKPELRIDLDIRSAVSNGEWNDRGACSVGHWSLLEVSSSRQIIPLFVKDFPDFLSRQSPA